MEISDKNICLTGKWIKIMKMRINKMHTRHKRGYKFTDKKQSKRGITAWILSVISLGGLIAVIACSFQDGGNGSMYLVKRTSDHSEQGLFREEVLSFTRKFAPMRKLCRLWKDVSVANGKFLSFFSLSCDRMLFPCCWGMGCTVYSWIFAVNKERNWCENKIFTRRNGGFI